MSPTVLAQTDDHRVTRSLLDDAVPDAVLAALLVRTDPASLDPDAQVSYVQACQRLINAVTARQDAGLVAFVGANPRNTVYFVDGGEHELTDARALELQLALAWGEGFTRSRIESARTMARLLPNCSALAAAGEIQPVVARAITDGVQSLTSSLDEAICIASRTNVPADQVDQLRQERAAFVLAFDSALSHFAPERSLKQIRRRIRDTIQRLDPDGVIARRAKAIRSHSDVRVCPLDDGMALLTAIMPAERAHACLRSIDLAARDTSQHDATELIGVRRSDALFDLLTRRPVATTPASDQGRAGLPAHVDLVMTLPAFLGLSDDPCSLPGVGALHAQAVRELLVDATYVQIRRLIADPRTGHVLDVGVKRYRLTHAERERIERRDRRCRMIDCSAPAYRCECDHAQAFGSGGPSSTANLGLLCKRHHQHKTHGGWRIVESKADGSCVWVSPLGRRYLHEPESVLPELDHGEPPPAD